MKICFIVGAFPKMKCGVGDYCCKLAKELAKNKKNEIYIITSTKASNKIEGIKVLNIIEKWNITSSKKIVKALKEIKPDIVNIQYPSNEYENVHYCFNILPLIIKMKIRCKLTETIHEIDLKHISIKSILKYKLNFMIMSKIIVVEHVYKDFIKKYFKKIKVEYISISASIPRVMINANEREEIRRNLEINQPKVISFFGFINEKKGIEKLLNALSKIDNVQLLIIGELNKENEYHKSILKQIETLKIEDKIKLTGYIESEEIVAKYLNATDLCVLPFTEGIQSRNSSFLAAYNQLIPIITTIKNKIKDEDGIFYVECNNEEELIERIKNVLQKNIIISRKELNWKSVAEKYINAF